MSIRLPTRLWVTALVRRAQLEGASAFILQTGDGERGDTLVKVATLDGQARLYSPSMSLEGDRTFMDLMVQGVGPDEQQIDDYINRAKARDRDLWVIEIEDKAGRHFLTEPVETKLS